ncbi:MAG TPA: methylated-DNA--[protein]-cysteine S-methyltransferase [Candidatus Limnocylindrales bacterium]|nr:methylated-DNA--[protein]-cysteine S-methyltransferase [Candidatus Limnocylindrales bacterium]
MPPLRFARVETSIGPMLAAETDLGVAAVARASSLEAFLEPLRRRFPAFEPVPGDLDLGWLTDAVEGLDAPLPAVDLRGLSGFDARVYEAVRACPRGETVTYGEVAVLIGSAGAARAVGGAMARCPLFPAVPCHRVVRASDGWSGWGGDDRLKQRLLNAESGTFMTAALRGPRGQIGP